MIIGFWFAAAVSAVTQAPSRTNRQVAVTFDDLPVVSRVFNDDAGHERITTRLVAAISRQRVPAIGFVNEGKMHRGGAVNPRQVALLRQWVSAGLELGNHSYSHFDLHTTDASTFIHDVVAGDSITRQVLDEVGRRPRYFRHPFLHTGRDLATRAQLHDSLVAHGYSVAPVTIDNYDYRVAAAYERALGHGDSAAARRVADEYLDYMTRVLAYYERQSTSLMSREIPQVLLLHASALNADTFDRMAGMIRARGYTFIPLDQAVADSAYRSSDTYVGPAGITWLHRWALTRGLRGAVFAGEPEVPEHIAAAAR